MTTSRARATTKMHCSANHQVHGISHKNKHCSSSSTSHSSSSGHHNQQSSSPTAHSNCVLASDASEASSCDMIHATADQERDIVSGSNCQSDSDFDSTADFGGVCTMSGSGDPDSIDCDQDSNVSALIICNCNFDQDQDAAPDQLFDDSTLSLSLSSQCFPMAFNKKDVIFSVTLSLNQDNI